MFVKSRLRTVVESGAVNHLDIFIAVYSLFTDLIIVLNHGEVVEQGTHQELLEKGGLYYDMWLEQATDAFAAEDGGEPESPDFGKTDAIPEPTPSDLKA